RREVRSMSQREFGRSEPGEDSINDRDEKRMDFLLQKVSSGGLDSLTNEEREFMINMSKRFRGRRN
ncbi:MAG: hypothetical protein ACKVX7_19520, partial [Planctomycetota bacterium]